MPAASAYVGGFDSGNGVRDELVLAPVAEPQKAEVIRQPSGLSEVEASASGALTPTRVRRAYTSAGSRVSVAAATAPTPDGWRRARVSWYGPGFIGHTMAGGGTLQWDSMVVAHRSLPFGTRIEFSYNGNTCIAVVADRGPYAGGRIFDLGPGTAAALGFGGVGTVDYRILN
jgi:rare lipoprotein A (peptidoglycan hydrolase)